MKYLDIVLGSNLFSCDLWILAFVGQTQINKSLKLGFLPFHSLKEVSRSALLGTLFKI